MKHLIPHEEYEIRVHAPMDARPCYYRILCGSETSDFNLFVLNDHGEKVLDQHLCQAHLLVQIVDVVLKGPSCLTPQKP